MRRNAKCQHVRGQPSNICMCATCASHAHPATICTCIAKTARTYWCPSPPSPNVFFTREISSEIETRRLAAFFIKKLDWFDFQSSIEYLSFYLFLHLSILIEGTDPFELMVFSYWFDLIHVSNVSNYRIFMIGYVHNKTSELIIQTNWETNVLKWISSIYRIGREESNFVNTNREVNRN